MQIGINVSTLYLVYIQLPPGTESDQVTEVKQNDLDSFSLPLLLPSGNYGKMKKTEVSQDSFIIKHRSLMWNSQPDRRHTCVMYAV